MRRLTFWQAVFLLVGTQIGAGILGLPKVVAPLGFFWGSVVLFVAALATLITALCIVEAIYLTNPGYHIYDLFTHYFGRAGKLFTLVLIVASYFTLVAYIFGLASVLSSITGLPELYVGTLAWAVIAFIIYKGLRVSGVAEEALGVILILLFSSVIVWAVPHVSGYYKPFNFDAFVYAFDVAVFAYFGHIVLPELVRGTGSKARTVFAVLTAFAVTTLVYLLFSLTVAGVTKENTTDIGTEGLISVLGQGFAFVGYLFPLLTITTSFIGVGLAQKDIIKEITPKGAWALAVLPPLLLFLAGWQGFVSAIWVASLGFVLVAGVIPPVLLFLARKEAGKRALPLDNGPVAVAFLLFLFVLVTSVVQWLEPVL